MTVRRFLKDLGLGIIGALPVFLYALLFTLIS